MTKEERLNLMTRGLRPSYIPEHCKLATQVLEDLKNTLAANNVASIDDSTWAYHIMVSGPNMGQLISLFCKGFRKTIDIQVLRRSGLADLRYKEVSFMTPLGASHHILKMQEKWRNPKC